MGRFAYCMSGFVGWLFVRSLLCLQCLFGMDIGSCWVVAVVVGACSVGMP